MCVYIYIYISYVYIYISLSLSIYLSIYLSKPIEPYATVGMAHKSHAGCHCPFQQNAVLHIPEELFRSGVRGALGFFGVKGVHQGPLWAL